MICALTIYLVSERLSQDKLLQIKFIFLYKNNILVSYRYICVYIYMFLNKHRPILLPYFINFFSLIECIQKNSIALAHAESRCENENDRNCKNRKSEIIDNALPITYI